MKSALILEVLHNISLLLALGFLYSVSIRRWDTKTVKGKVIVGILFGGAAMVGMLLPMQYAPGIIFDGRSILLGIIGLFGGAIAASVAVLMTVALRLWQGGTGAAMGVATILSTAGIGVLFHHLRPRYSWLTKAVPLWGFGLLIHADMLVCALLLPAQIRWRVFDDLVVPLLVVYPIATMLYGRLIVVLEERSLAEDLLQETNERLERKVKERTQELDNANESLAARNEEINAMNEELMAQNEEILAMNDELTAKNEDIATLNQNLMGMNEELERRVAERTADLTAAHEELTAQFEELKQTQETLVISEARLTRAQMIAQVGDWEIEIDTQKVWASAAAFQIYGVEHTSPYLPLHLVQQLVCEEDRPRLDRALKSLLQQNGKYDVEFKIKRADNGLERSLHSIAELEYDPNGKPIKIIGVIQDVTERKQAEEILIESEARYRAVIEQAPEAILLSDLETTEIIETNSCFTQLFGYDVRQDGPLTMYDIIDDSRSNIQEMLKEVKRNGILPPQRRLLRHKNGTRLDVERTATLVHYRKRNLLVQTLRDVSDEVRRERENHFQATHDDLTGLYNRRGFSEAMTEKWVEGAAGALLLVDIDDFKIINSVHGYGIGDRCLAAFGAKLREIYGETFVMARLGGNEFILFFAGSEGLHQATQACRTMDVVCLETESGPFFVQLSGGISLLTDQEPNLDMQVQRAYLALHHVKESGKGCCEIYESTLQDKVNRRYAVKEALNNALAGNEFHLVFQPIYDIQVPREKITGYEALLRWTNPRLGVVSPMEFIPVAEETNLILPIGRWVLREACRFSANISKRYGECVNISVNISMRQLAMPSFVNMVKETLHETGLPAGNLNLEVTESILMTDPATRVAYLQELRDFGVAISLDDFGTGYSSFTYLAQMPITTLKIDKIMVGEIRDGSARKNLLLIESLLQMSALLGYKVVAEGVETIEQLNYLKNKGCGYCQGYLLSRPLPEKEVLAMYQEQLANDENLNI